VKQNISLKDHLFNEEKVSYLAYSLKQAHQSFRSEEFVIEVMGKLGALELKDRIRWIAEVLTRYLPRNYDEAIAVMIQSLPPPLDPTKTDDDFGEFILAPFGEYVAKHGCINSRLTTSFRALEEFTMRFSMEDSVRHFLRAFPVETLAVCRDWSRHQNYHVRRLVSEGTRPLLPWSGRVDLKASDTLPLLSVLHADPTRYVTRSVANHLNDLAKIEPAMVIKTLNEWQTRQQQSDKEFSWLMRHALRTLVKQGNKEALTMLGFGQPKVKVQHFEISNQKSNIARGDILEFQAILCATDNSNLLIDYVVYFIKKQGRVNSKVFKWKTVYLRKGEQTVLTKRHLLKADATTFKLYPGEHQVVLQVNGERLATSQFMLH